MRALISWALYFFLSMVTDQLVPIWRLTERMVRSGLVMAWRLATSPTSTSPVLEKPTTEGVVRPPSALGMTVGSPASRTETTELVVPRSIPTALGMGVFLPSSVDGNHRSGCGRVPLQRSVAKLSAYVSSELQHMIFLFTDLDAGPVWWSCFGP